MAVPVSYYLTRMTHNLSFRYHADMTTIKRVRVSVRLRFRVRISVRVR